MTKYTNSAEPLELAIPAKGIIPLEDLFEEQGEGSEILCDMAEQAQAYLESYEWCKAIEEAYFGDGIPDVAGIAERFLSLLWEGEDAVRQVTALGQCPVLLVGLPGGSVWHVGILR